MTVTTVQTTEPRERDGETPEISFGIGCFHFGLRSQGPFTFIPERYRTLLAERLQRISAVNNLVVAIGDSDSVQMHGGSLPTLESGDGFFPAFDECAIHFDLYIPERIQRELAADSQFIPSGAEQFRVHLQYHIHGPVTFVELLNVKHSDHPSTAVQVVREFLKREWAREPSEFTFECLGPSPFHADCHLQSTTAFPADSDAILFEALRMNLGGYSDLYFSYQRDDFTDSALALDALMDELGWELSLFYEAERRAVRSYERWSDIEAQILALTEDVVAPGVRARIGNRLTRGRDLARLQKNLVHFEAERLVEKHQSEQAFRHMYDTDRPQYLRESLEELLKDAPVFPTTQMTHLIGFLEQRRSQALELAVALLAAVVGGVVGALITLAVT